MRFFACRFSSAQHMSRNEVNEADEGASKWLDATFNCDEAGLPLLWECILFTAPFGFTSLPYRNGVEAQKGKQLCVCACASARSPIAGYSTRTMNTLCSDALGHGFVASSRPRDSDHSGLIIWLSTMYACVCLCMLVCSVSGWGRCMCMSASLMALPGEQLVEAVVLNGSMEAAKQAKQKAVRIP